MAYMRGNNSQEEGIVYCVFDLETTSLRDCDLTQISGQTLDGQRTFNVYILPRRHIDATASELTGITKAGNQLFVHGEVVASVNIREGLTLFADWLRSFDRDIILVGHNIERFDMPHLLRHVRVNNLMSRFQRVMGTLDTLPLLRFLHRGKRSYSLSNMYMMLFRTTFEAHGAVEDCRAVARILNEGGVGEDVKYQFTNDYSF